MRRFRMFLLMFMLLSVHVYGVELKDAIRSLTTLECDFVQTKHLRMLNDKMVSNGRMYYQRGDKLRWEYQKPYRYTLVMNGDKVLLKNDRRNDVIDVRQNKLFREIARIMMGSVVGDCLDDERTFKTSLTTNGSEWVATLTPLRKEMKGMFEKIVLHFDQHQAVVTRVVLTEKNGDETTIELKNIRKNETIAPSLFVVE